LTTLTTTARAAAPAPIKRLLAQHPLLAYFGIAFAGTWSMLLVPVLAQNGLGVLPFLVPDIAVLLLFITGTLAGPTLGALLVTAATGGRLGLRQFFRRYVQVRVGLLHMVWHLPVFFMTEGQMAMGPFNAGDFVYKILTSMVLAVIWTWVFNNARGSIFMALVLHGTNNAIGVLIHGWGPQFSTAAVSTLGDILLAVCALLIIVFTRGRLSYTPGLALQSADMPQPEDVPLPQARKCEQLPWQRKRHYLNVKHQAVNNGKGARHVHQSSHRPTHNTYPIRCSEKTFQFRCRLAGADGLSGARQGHHHVLSGNLPLGCAGRSVCLALPGRGDDRRLDRHLVLPPSRASRRVG